MQEYKFDKVGAFGKDQSDAAQRLIHAQELTKLFTARELSRLVEVAKKEPMKVSIAKKALGL